MPSDFNLMQQRAWAIAEKSGFHEPKKRWAETHPRKASPLERLALIVSEAAEALEHVRDSEDFDPTAVIYKDDKPEKPDGFPVEIADVVIRCMDLAEEYGFDLESMIELKMDYNATRPYLHGRTI